MKKETFYKKPGGGIVLHIPDSLDQKQFGLDTSKAKTTKDKKAKTIRIARDLVLLKPIAPVTQTESGIAIISTSKVAPKAYIVIKTGPGAYDKFGNFLEVPCQPGDMVMVAQGNNHEIEIADEKFTVAPASEILVIVR